MSQLLVPWREGYVRLLAHESGVSVEFQGARIEIGERELRVSGRVGRESLYATGSAQRIFIPMELVGMRSKGAPTRRQNLRIGDFLLMRTAIWGNHYITVRPLKASKLEYVVISPSKVMVVAKGKLTVISAGSSMSIKIA